MSALIRLLTADEALLRRVAELLAPLGCRVVHGGAGKEQPAGSNAAEVDLLIIDGALEGCDASTLVRRHLASGSRPAPVLVLADRSDAESAVAASLAGAADVLFKPFDALGFPARVSSLLQGRRLEEAQERLQTLEFRNSELESFVYIVTHDMKTPVVNLQGLVGLLEQDHGADLPEPARDYLGRLRRNAERLEELLRDLLEYPRRFSVVGPKSPQDLSAVVASAVDGLRENAEAAGVEIEVEPNLPTVPCDAKRVQQVIHNLVENAIKYAGDVPKPHVEVGARRTAEGLRVHVRDNGPGIPEDQRTEIFRLFHRLPSAKANGTGIGLAIARQLVEAHGGEIWCESEEGKGSTFYFTLGPAD